MKDLIFEKPSSIFGLVTSKSGLRKIQRLFSLHFVFAAGCACCFEMKAIFGNEINKHAKETDTILCH